MKLLQLQIIIAFQGGHRSCVETMYSETAAAAGSFFLSSSFAAAAVTADAAITTAAAAADMKDHRQ